MKFNLRTFKPSPLSILLAVLILGAQVALFSWSSTTYSVDGKPNVLQTSFGLGSPIVFTETDGFSRYQIRWGVLGLNLATTWALAIVLANGLLKATRLRRPARAYALVTLAMVAVAFLISIGISRAYWGYFLARPGLLPEVSQIAAVRAIVPVCGAPDNAGGLAIVVDTNTFSLTERLASGRADPYYCLDERILIELDKNKLLPATHASTLSGFPELYPLLKESAVLAESDEGYDSAALLRGIVVDAIGKSGQRLVFLALTGGQVSNDHRPYYETVFVAPKDGAELSFVRGQRFFYDVAGIEGMEWYVIWIFVSLAAIVVGVVLFTIGCAVWGMISKPRPIYPAAVES